MIAGEYRPLADEREAQMVRRMSGHMQHIQRKPASLDCVAVRGWDVRLESRIYETVAKAGRNGAALGSGRAKGEDLAAEALL